MINSYNINNSEIKICFNNFEKYLQKSKQIDHTNPSFIKIEKVINVPQQCKFLLENTNFLTLLSQIYENYLNEQQFCLQVIQKILTFNFGHEKLISLNGKFLILGTKFLKIFIQMSNYTQDVQLLILWSFILSQLCDDKDVQEFIIATKFELLYNALLIISKLQKEQESTYIKNFYVIVLNILKNYQAREIFIQSQYLELFFTQIYRNILSCSELNQFLQIVQYLCSSEIFPDKINGFYIQFEFLVQLPAYLLQFKEPLNSNLNMVDIFKGKEIQQNELVIILAKIFVSFLKNRQLQLRILDQINSQDFILLFYFRFLLQLIKYQQNQASLYYMLGLHSILQNSKFSKLINLQNISLIILSELLVTKNQDLVFITFLRTLKYVNFDLQGRNKIIELIKLIFENQNYTLEEQNKMNLEQIDVELIANLKQNKNNYTQILQKDQNGNPIYVVLKVDYSLSSSQQLNYSHLTSKDFYNSYSLCYASKPKNQNDQQQANKQTRIQSPRSPHFFYKDKQNNIEQKQFLFKNCDNEDFSFIRHLNNRCSNCKLLQSVYSLSNEQYDNFYILYLIPDQQTPKHLNFEKNFALLQYIFELSLWQSIQEMSSSTILLLCELLADKKLNNIYKFVIPLFLQFQINVYSNKKEQQQLINYYVSLNLHGYYFYFMKQFAQFFQIQSLYYTRNKIFTQLGLEKTKIEKINQLGNPFQIEQDISLIIEDMTPEIWQQQMRTKKYRNSEENKILIFEEKEFGKKISNIAKNQSQQMVYPTAHFDKLQKKFKIENQNLQSIQVLASQQIQQDYTLGKHSYFFWILHSLFHFSQLIVEIFKLNSKVKNNNNILLLKEQTLKEQNFLILLEFLKTLIQYQKKFIPTEPFHADTENWNDIRNIIIENISILLQYFEMILEKIPETYNIMIYQKKEIILDFIDLIGNISILRCSNSLLKIILKCVENNNELHIINFYNLTRNMSVQMQQSQEKLNAIFMQTLQDGNVCQIKQLKQYLKSALYMLHISNIFLIKVNISAIEQQQNLENIEIMAQFSLFLIKLSHNLIIQKKFALLKEHINQLLQVSCLFYSIISQNQSFCNALMRMNALYTIQQLIFQKEMYASILNDNLFIISQIIFNYFKHANSLNFLLQNQCNFLEELQKQMTHINANEKSNLPLVRGIKELIKKCPTEISKFNILIPILKNQLQKYKVGQQQQKYYNNNQDFHKYPNEKQAFQSNDNYNEFMQKQLNFTLMNMSITIIQQNKQDSKNMIQIQQQFLVTQLFTNEASTLLQLLDQNLLYQEKEQCFPLFRELLLRNKLVKGAGLLSRKTLKEYFQTQVQDQDNYIQKWQDFQFQKNNQDTLNLNGYISSQDESQAFQQKVKYSEQNRSSHIISQSGQSIINQIDKAYLKILQQHMHS